MTTKYKIFSLERLLNGLLSQVTQLESENNQLRKENIILLQENLDLRSRLDKYSKNSHKLLSSEDYSKKTYRLHPALPKPVGKTLVGQSSHQIKTLEIVSIPDTIIDFKLIPNIDSEFYQIYRQGVQQEPQPLKTNDKKRRITKSKGLNLRQRLKNSQDAILSFTFYQKLPFTNNQAERDLRMVKTKMKISTCFRTLVRAKLYTRIQEFISTNREQQLNPFQNLKLFFDNQFQWTWFLNNYVFLYLRQYLTPFFR